MKLTPQQKKSTSIPERVSPEPFSEALFERPFHPEPSALSQSRRPGTFLNDSPVPEKASRASSAELLQFLANRKEKS